VLVYVIAEGAAVAAISAAEIAAAFLIWGLLMGMTGAAAMWLFSGERLREYDETYEPAHAAPDDDDIDTQEIPGHDDDTQQLRLTPRAHHTGTIHGRPLSERTTVVIPRVNERQPAVTEHATQRLA
jgi:hypothetical protein